MGDWYEQQETWQEVNRYRPAERTCCVCKHFHCDYGPGGDCCHPTVPATDEDKRVRSVPVSDHMTCDLWETSDE